MWSTGRTLHADVASLIEILGYTWVEWNSGSMDWWGVFWFVVWWGFSVSLGFFN